MTDRLPRRDARRGPRDGPPALCDGWRAPPALCDGWRAPPALCDGWREAPPARCDGLRDAPLLTLRAAAGGGGPARGTETRSTAQRGAGGTGRGRAWGARGAGTASHSPLTCRRDPARAPTAARQSRDAAQSQPPVELASEAAQRGP